MSTGSSALPQIIALGGHSITANEEDAALSRYILDQVAASRAGAAAYRVGPTPSGFSESRLNASVLARVGKWRQPENHMTNLLSGAL